LRIVFVVTSNTKIKLLAWCLLGFILLVFLWHQITVSARPVIRPGLPLSQKVIAIDPGHGGYDPGGETNGILEKDIALAISLLLRDYLQAGGARVVMTREGDYDLLDLPVAGPKKKRDMEHRKQIIDAANPDLVVSIHVNAISSSRWSGSQVFYREDSPEGRRLALIIQEELTRVLKNTNRQAKPGNYFITNESDAPAAIVETGFISNPKEARLLANRRYQSQLAWAVFLGINRYFTDQPPGLD
jgi:N-acetylmuramoyl-L-alanine amidase